MRVDLYNLKMIRGMASQAQLFRMIGSARWAPARLDGFSHVEAPFHFYKVPENEVQMGARHSHVCTDWPLVGIFAQRGNNRPARIGVTVCRLLSVEGRIVKVRAPDAIDGTPVLDMGRYRPENLKDCRL
jgi:tRNA (Thr-GGU) A37 N-methylase